MIVIADSTVFFHFNYHYEKMQKIIEEKNIKQVYISRIGYLEILSGASENAKRVARKFLSSYPVIEFDGKVAQTAANLAMRYRVGSKQSKDFLIASTAVANKIPLLTENTKDFNYKELTVISYKISE